MTTRPYTVAVDIDGPLYELVNVLRRRLVKVTGRPEESFPEPNIYNLTQAWGLGPTELIDQLADGLREGDIFWQGEAHQPGIEGLHALKEADYHVVLITARDFPGVEELAYEATSHWLSNVGAVYDALHVTSLKTDLQWDFLIDDYEKNVRAGHAAGRDAILMRRPWNVNVDLPQADWSEIPDLIEEAIARSRRVA